MDSASPLHILLTNDDGHSAPGIRTLREVLKERGYRVSMVAPSSEQSATSMSTTMNRNIVLEQVEEDSWHLDAQPADTVLVALRHLFEDDTLGFVAAWHVGPLVKGLWVTIYLSIFSSILGLFLMLAPMWMAGVATGFTCSTGSESNSSTRPTISAMAPPR